MNNEIYKENFSIARILKESWKRYIENFYVILKIILIVYIPINIFLSFIPVEQIMTEKGSIQGLRLYLKIIELLEALFGVIASMSIAYLIKSSTEGKITQLKQVLNKSLSRWLILIKTNIRMSVFLLLLTILFIIPGIIYCVYWIFVMYAVILENKSGKEALDHSKEIVKGRWWKVATYSCLFGLMAIITGFIIGTVPYLFIPDNKIIGIFTDTLIDIVLAYYTVVLTMFYLNVSSSKNKFKIGKKP